MREKGITLIALVITIIVLLILAGVSIAMLTGENGILTQAQKSSEQSDIGKEEEQIALAYNGAKTENEGGDVDADDLNRNFGYSHVNATASGSNPIKVKFSDSGREYEVNADGTIIRQESSTKPNEDEAVVGEIVQTGSGNKEYTNNGFTAKIPEGFMIVPGCDDITEGLVISDNPADTEIGTIVANGNQFVWIPVTSESQYIRNEEYDYASSAYADSDYLPDGIAPDIPKR